MEYVTGSPISRVNPWYLRFTAQDAGQGFWNKAYDGIYLEKGKTYTVRFYARAAQYPEGNITVQVTKDGRICAQAEVSCIHAPEKTWQKWNLYEAVLEAGETIRNGRFTTVSYTHLDVYKRQGTAQQGTGERFKDSGFPSEKINNFSNETENTAR